MASEANWTVQALLEHAEWIRKLAHVLVRDPALAEDLAQDTWVAALRTPPKEQGPLKPWLATILRNLVRERARGNQRRTRREQAAEIPQTMESVEDLAQRAEAQRLLVEFVLELAPHYRDVVLLSYFEGLSSVEIAERLGIPDVTVRSRLKRGLDQLRERFDRKYGDRKAWIVMLMPLGKRPGDGVAGVDQRGSTSGAASASSGWVAASAAIAIVTVAIMWWARSDDVSPTPVASDSVALLPTTPERSSPIAEDRSAVASASAPPQRSRAPLGAFGVTVRGADGRPVRDAVVRIATDFLEKDSVNEVQRRPHVSLAIAELKTDATGRASFEWPLGSTFDVEVVAAGSAPVQRLRRSAGSQETIELTAPCALHGRVVHDADGTPVDGAKVFMMRPGQPSGIATSRTGPDGTFELTGLPAGPLVVSASSERLRHRDIAVTLVPGRAIECEVRLRRWANLRGRIVDRATGAAIANAEVGWWRCPGTVRTDASGSFDVDGYSGNLDATDFAWVRAQGYGFRTFFPAKPEGVEPTVSITLELERSNRVEGTLVDESGAALGGKRILAVARQSDPNRPLDRFPLGVPRSDLVEGVTAADGSFALSDLRPDVVHSILVVDDAIGRIALELPRDLAAGTVRNVGVVRVPSARSVFGQVLDAHGDPVAGERVVLVPHESARRALVGDDGARVEGYVIDGQTTRTDSAGRFCFPFTAPGGATLRLIDRSQRELVRQDLEVDSDLEVTLRVAAVPVIAGTVRDPVGNPIESADVVVLAVDESEEWSVPTDARGSFCFRDLRAASYFLRVRPPDPGPNSLLGSTDLLTISPPNLALELTLPFVHRVDVSVVDPAGRAVAGARVEFVAAPPGSARVYAAETSASGRITMAVAPNTTFDVTVVPRSDGKPGTPIKVQHACGSRDERSKLTVVVGDSP